MYMQSLLTTIGYHVGRYGPLFLGVLVSYLLWPLQMKRDVFIVGFIINLLINGALKLLIKQRRPDKHKSDSLLSAFLDTSKPKKMDKNEAVAHSYGMPSGHAQSAIYCLAYIMYTLQSTIVTLFFLFFALWTCIQRVVFKRHYVDQIIVGALVGFMLAYYSYKLSLALVEEKDKMYV